MYIVPKEKGPWIAPEAWFRLIDNFDLAGDDVVDGSLPAGYFPASPHTEPSDDVDGTPDFQLIKVLDVFAFPRSDLMPGGFDGLEAVRCEVFAWKQKKKESVK